MTRLSNLANLGDLFSAEDCIDTVVDMEMSKSSFGPVQSSQSISEDRLIHKYR